MRDKSPAAARRGRGSGCVLAALMLLGSAGACVPSGTDTKGLPPNIEDPSRFRTPGGALALYRGVLASLPQPLEGYLAETGTLTDELEALPVPATQNGLYTNLDSRQSLAMPSGFDYYALFHQLRARAQESRGFLAAYASDSSPALRGHLFALEGYAEILLAELYCSGIPLSTVQFDGDYTLAPGSTTHEVYAHAVALFDSATALFDSAVARGEADSMRLRSLAAVGRGRALLGQGRYAEAAAAVSAVPDGFIYQLDVPASGPLTNFGGGGDRLLSLFALYYPYELVGANSGVPRVADGEGGLGLFYRSSADPRVLVDTLGQDPLGHPMYFPAKYPQSGPATFTLADAVEARLIQAEADLHADPAGGGWLTRLNQLRQTVGLVDTTDPGAGLSEPAATRARVDLLFRERAFWLYLTGHRQGDLRRLVREYGRPREQVYPFGSYAGGSAGFYGDAIVLPVPERERQLNPKYTGCFNLGA